MIQLDLPWLMEIPAPPGRADTPPADARAERLLAALRHQADESLAHRWPVTLSHLVDVALAEARRRNPEAQAADLVPIVAAIACYLSGWNYLPSPTKIEASLRDARIWREFDGRNHRELAERYRLSRTSIYRILQEQRRVEQSKRRAAGAAPQGRWGRKGGYQQEKSP